MKTRIYAAPAVKGFKIKQSLLHVMCWSTMTCVNPYNAEIFLYKPWRPFEIIINVSVNCFRFI